MVRLNVSYKNVCICFTCACKYLLKFSLQNNNKSLHIIIAIILHALIGQSMIFLWKNWQQLYHQSHNYFPQWYYFDWVSNTLIICVVIIIHHATFFLNSLSRPQLTLMGSIRQIAALVCWLFSHEYVTQVEGLNNTLFLKQYNAITNAF